MSDRHKLRHPYKHWIPEAAWAEFYGHLKQICKDPRLQYPDAAYRKGLTYGYKVNVFMLGYRPGLCGDSLKAKGFTEEQWLAATHMVKVFIKSHVSGADIRVNAWSSTRKFALQWEAYIQTRETDAEVIPITDTQRLDWLIQNHVANFECVENIAGNLDHYHIPATREDIDKELTRHRQ